MKTIKDMPKHSRPHEKLGDQFYRTKQLEVIAVADGDDWLVLTVIVRYF